MEPENLGGTTAGRKRRKKREKGKGKKRALIHY